MMSEYEAPPDKETLYDSVSLLLAEPWWPSHMLAMRAHQCLPDGSVVTLNDLLAACEPQLAHCATSPLGLMEARNLLHHNAELATLTQKTAAMMHAESDYLRQLVGYYYDRWERGDGDLFIDEPVSPALIQAPLIACWQAHDMPQPLEKLAMIEQKIIDAISLELDEAPQYLNARETVIHRLLTAYQDLLQDQPREVTRALNNLLENHSTLDCTADTLLQFKQFEARDGYEVIEADAVLRKVDRYLRLNPKLAQELEQIWQVTRCEKDLAMACFVSVEMQAANDPAEDAQPVDAARRALKQAYADLPIIHGLHEAEEAVRAQERLIELAQREILGKSAHHARLGAL